jgi:hypothetical protein
VPSRCAGTPTTPCMGATCEGALHAAGLELDALTRPVPPVWSGAGGVMYGVCLHHTQQALCGMMYHLCAWPIRSIMMPCCMPAAQRGPSPRKRALPPPWTSFAYAGAQTGCRMLCHCAVLTCAPLWFHVN